MAAGEEKISLQISEIWYSYFLIICVLICISGLNDSLIIYNHLLDDNMDMQLYTTKSDCNNTILGIGAITIKREDFRIIPLYSCVTISDLQIEIIDL